MTATEDHPPTQAPQSHSPVEAHLTEDVPPPSVSPPSVSPPAASNTPSPVAAHPVPSERVATPPAAPTENVSSTPPPTTETPLDPRVAALLAMFPDFDTSLLESVLESVGGDQDQAVDVLLGMSDPNYTSTSTGRADLTQTELDEEIARRLMLEETEQQQRQYQRQPSWRPQGPDAPYQARSHGASHTQGGPDGSQQRPAEGDGMAQFQEQLGKFAETGKKTFNTLLSKVKAKMQEFDGTPGQGQGQGQPSGSTHPLPHGDSWNTPAQSQSYYDPNPPRQFEGYDAEPNQISMNSAPTPAAPHSASCAPPAPSSTTDPSAPPPTNAGAPVAGNVDPSKIGLLPKRPVSLGSSPQPSRNFNDDEVEYVENPFEESTRR